MRQGDKTIDEVQSEIKAEPDFCREQDAIEFNYLYTSLFLGEEFLKVAYK